MIVHGKKSLKNLLKSGKPLEVFTIKDKNLKKFCHDAKRRGVKYCVIRDKDRDDHTVDILADIDNLKMCNYIIERNKCHFNGIRTRRCVIAEQIIREARGCCNSNPVTPHIIFLVICGDHDIKRIHFAPPVMLMGLVTGQSS